MRKTFTAILFFVGFLSGFAQNSVISGKLIAELPEETELIARRTKVILEINEKIITAELDDSLNFSFYDLKAGNFKIRTEPKPAGTNRIIIDSLKTSDTLNIKLPYVLTCKFDKSKKDKTCPICHKKDEVIPIHYGLIVDINNGEDKKEKEYKSGGCVTTGCDPNWYCKRDEIEF
jgi:hypothetical protein